MHTIKEGGYALDTHSIEVKKYILHEDLYFESKLVLKYTIEYPQFQSNEFLLGANRMNQFYNEKAIALQRYTKQTVFKDAVEHFRYSVANSFPIMAYEVYSTYEVTFNQDCTFSMYSDCYIYEGGAHGITTRTSQTWNLQTGIRIPLYKMFPISEDIRKFISAYIVDEMKNQVKSNKDIMYFEPYEENVKKYFTPQNYYLVKQGVIIYFQQYELAPYVAGMPEFLIPAGNKVTMPTCSNYK